ncbi:DUF4097 and DUF4098 domain-containing protein YvlB [Halobacillus karajensis]|uniref:Uncharacterized protein n=1 Tax=Halobacillus karajensis TaxID=195088 RepID=A0A059NV05_9BACI|nr:DUF4097 family beta strand repeat-containing protein [Halobacillus karajensis]CDQ19237.1 hypothetical protein BN982_01522 [Halobacillus karajensis]CDQ22689.1 hypothetical protein BN983_00904 [Halobacillus karajensis]CDQ26171.1 hypothetical protein BN981_00384 [Halobacillus karajensis]SEH39607.1 DUF4097 and DUF4098 domain-containing protein YvlB [Halobacillus karajensis]
MNEERMKILRMIEEGTISAEEGANLLSAVDESSKKDSAQTQQEKNRYGIRSFLGDAMEKIKNADFDLSFGEYVEYHDETIFYQESFNDVDLSISNGSVKIHTWGKDEVKASYGVKVYQVENEEEAKERFQEEVQIAIKNGVFRLASPSKKLKINVELFLPEKIYAFIKSQLTNGKLNIENIESDHFQLKTSNGPVYGERVSGKTCKIQTGNGEIELKGSRFDDCEADTINGAIKITGDVGKIDASAVSGAITIDHKGKGAHTGFYKTTTGRIQVSLPSEKRIDGVLKTKIGYVSCELENYKILKDKKDVINKMLEFEAYEQFEEAYHIEAETKTGSVTLQPPVKL